MGDLRIEHWTLRVQGALWGVRVHHDRDGLWAEVTALPGCFAASASGDRVELEEAITEAIGLYLADPDHDPIMDLMPWGVPLLPPDATAPPTEAEGD